jgi:hypothetical protein
MRVRCQWQVPRPMAPGGPTVSTVTRTVVPSGYYRPIATSILGCLVTVMASDFGRGRGLGGTWY